MCATRNRLNAKQLRADGASRGASRAIANAQLQVGGGANELAAWTRKRCEAFVASYAMAIDARRLSVARFSAAWPGQTVVVPIVPFISAHLRKYERFGFRVTGEIDRPNVGADADAVRLFAAAEANLTRMGAVRQPQPMFDAVAEIARVRERVDADEFDAAWDEGSKLSLEDAIAFASRGWGPRNRPQAGWDALTPTELKVVDLVAAGLSNPQIAGRLFISPRTVSTHLSHVFAKVGVSSRAELAVAMTKRSV